MSILYPLLWDLTPSNSTSWLSFPLESPIHFPTHVNVTHSTSQEANHILSHARLLLVLQWPAYEATSLFLLIFYVFLQLFSLYSLSCLFLKLSSPHPTSPIILSSSISFLHEFLSLCHPLNIGGSQGLTHCQLLFIYSKLSLGPFYGFTYSPSAPRSVSPSWTSYLNFSPNGTLLLSIPRYLQLIIYELDSSSYSLAWSKVLPPTLSIMAKEWTPSLFLVV